MGKLVIALLAFILAASLGVHAAVQDTTTGAPEGDEAVVTLTTKSFDEFVNEHEYSLVEFYAPWCGHCKKLAPEYEEAAKKLKGKVPLAKVDATVETDLASKFSIQGYPTIKAFRKGVAEDYKGGRTKDTIIQYVEKMTGPTVEIVEKASGLEEAYSGSSVAFIGKFKAKDSPAFKAFEKVASASRTFGKFIAIFGADNKDELVVYREGEGLADPLPIADEESLTKSCDLERFPYFGPVNAANFADYFDTKRTLVWFAGSEKDFEAAAKEVRTTAKQFRGEYNFVWLNSDEFKDYAENVLGVKEFPGLVVQGADGRYSFPDHKFDSNAKLTQFMHDVVDGKIEKSLMSDDIPETNDEPVKVVVGKTFNEIVQQKDKDVMLEVYAPWCGHCKKLEPIYNEFAESMKDSRHLVIAKMDGTKNESPNSEFKWTGFPTIFFVKAGSNKPELFDGPRTLEGLTEYVKEHSSKPLDLETPKDEL